MFGANSMDESLKKLLPVYALVFLRARARVSAAALFLAIFSVTNVKIEN